jgi:hypothetical protein
MECALVSPAACLLASFLEGSGGALAFKTCDMSELRWSSHSLVFTRTLNLTLRAAYSLTEAGFVVSNQAAFLGGVRS